MSELELNDCPFYTAYYENDFGNYLPAYLTQSPDIASQIDCSVVKAEDYELLRQKLEAAEAESLRLTHERQCLAESIGELAVIAGDTRTNFTGPDLLMVCRDFGEAYKLMDSAIREAREQKPYGWFSEREDFTRNEQTMIAYRSHGWTPLFKSPVPAMPIQDDRIFEALKVTTANMRNHVERIKCPENHYWWKVITDTEKVIESAMSLSEVKPSC